MIRADIDELLQKQMDRKDFIKHAGIAVVALTGLSGILKMLVNTQTNASNGYGSSLYGGAKRTDSAPLLGSSR